MERNVQNYLFCQALCSLKNAAMVHLVEDENGFWGPAPRSGKVGRGQNFATRHTAQGLKWLRQIVDERGYARRVNPPTEEAFGTYAPVIEDPFTKLDEGIKSDRAQFDLKTGVLPKREKRITASGRPVGEIVNPALMPDPDDGDDEGDIVPVEDPFITGNGGVSLDRRSGSYYYFTDGERVQGKVPAREYLASVNPDLDPDTVEELVL